MLGKQINACKANKHQPLLVKMLWKQGKKKKQNHFSRTVFEGHVFPHLQSVVVAGYKLIKLCCDYGLRLCNSVIWATEQYKALSQILKKVF